MCHRYKFQLSLEAAIAKFGIEYVDAVQLEKTEFFPLSVVPAVRLNQKDERELVGFEWGLLPHWWNPEKQKGTKGTYQRKCYNARSETVHEKNSYREPFKSKRCLLLATEFFEYGSFFHLPKKEPFAIAAIWDSWSFGDEKKESCSMLTTAANNQVGQVHPKKRMPVVLPNEESIKLWLSADIAERNPLEELFQSFPDELMGNYVEQKGT